MKKSMLMLLVIFIIVPICSAMNTPLGEVAVDFDATWNTKYLWRGFDLLDDKAAFQPSVNMDFGNGLSFNLWSSFAGASKNGGSLSTVDADEMNYTLTYSNSVYEGQPSAMDYAVSWIYYDFTDTASNVADAQEFNIDFAFPEICPGRTVPHYQVIYMWSAQGGGPSNDIEGFIHVFGIGYDFTVSELEQPISFSADITYNDNAGAETGDIDHDWSHITWGLSTSIDCPAGGTITPAIYYQTSMDDSVNKSDEFYAGISYGISF